MSKNTGIPVIIDSDVLRSLIAIAKPPSSDVPGDTMFRVNFALHAAEQVIEESQSTDMVWRQTVRDSYGGERVRRRPDGWLDEESYIEAAANHGEESGNDMEIGDLQDMLRIALKLLIGEQRKQFQDSIEAKAVAEWMGRERE